MVTIPSWFPWLAVWCVAATLPAGTCAAADIGTFTLVEGGGRVLRGVTWYKLAPGAVMEEGDIVDAAERAQVQVEFPAGGAANLSGPGQLYAVPGKPGIVVLAVPQGWLKVTAKNPGVRLRTEPFDVTLVDGTLVLHADGQRAEVFVEDGRARLAEITAQGAEKAAREARRGTYWARAASEAYTTVPRAPRTFVAAMPRHFVDPLPTLRTRAKGKPALVALGDISYAEAEPWLEGPDRRVFERRFTSRLRDAEFRKAVAPDIARYPRWDRMLHPEKFEPKPKPVPVK